MKKHQVLTLLKLDFIFHFSQSSCKTAVPALVHVTPVPEYKMENLIESEEPFLSMVPDHIPPKESDFGAKSTLLPDTTPLSPNRFISLAVVDFVMLNHIFDEELDTPQLTVLLQHQFPSNEFSTSNSSSFAEEAAGEEEEEVHACSTPRIKPTLRIPEAVLMIFVAFI